MSKTSFGPGVVVTSKWLNGAQQIYFDGLDLDWHYPPLSTNDIQLGGINGLDGRYVTLNTAQTYENTPITHPKSFMGLVEYGSEYYAEGRYAPKSWSTNAKFATGFPCPTWDQQWDALEEEDLVTKAVLDRAMHSFIIDEGYYGPRKK